MECQSYKGFTEKWAIFGGGGVFFGILDTIEIKTGSYR